MTTDTGTRSIRPAARLRGEVAVPGDKSISHRALIFNAIARGRARVDGFLASEDTESTIDCLRTLGANIEQQPDGSVIVEGNGRAALSEAFDVLDCGNSGTTMRLLAGLVAGLPGLAVLTGDETLRRRPMDRIVGPLNELGARVTARAEGTLPPIVIHGGNIAGGQRLSPPMASAQVKSAILLAGLAADGPTTVVESASSRDHTERLLAAMGATFEIEGTAVTITPPEGDLIAVDVRVPGDISTAAAWIVAATVHPDAELLLTGVGINPTRSGILDVLRAMGADIELTEQRTVGGEPVADLVVRSAPLHGIEIGGADLIPRMIDELPLAALAGALAAGETVIRDAEELRVKESNRVATTAATLRAFGVDIEERDDGFRVTGGATLRSASVDSAGDHRLAILGAIAGLLAAGETRVSGAGVVVVSYPAFWSDLDRLSQD
jgi:3-phosphoshikimate 1-carboxyvinyltransferase